MIVIFELSRSLPLTPAFSSVEEHGLLLRVDQTGSENESKAWWTLVGAGSSA